LAYQPGLKFSRPNKLCVFSAVEYISGEPVMGEPPSEFGAPLPAPVPRSV
jgi:hypothetical protein